MSCLPNLSSITLIHPQRWSSLETEIRRVDLVLSTAPEEIRDKCKTLCETVMKTIIISALVATEQECEAMNMDGLKTLVCRALALEDEDLVVTKAEILFLTRARNRSGMAGHGRSLQRQGELRGVVDERGNERLLGMTDTLLGNLIHQFEKKFPLAQESPGRNNDYDIYLDAVFGKLIINDTEYVASDILYEVDPIAYEEGLRQFSESQSEQSDE